MCCCSCTFIYLVMGQFPWGENFHGAKCPWASCSWGELSMWQNVYGAKCLWGMLSMGRVVYGAKCHGASCPWGELSWGKWPLGTMSGNPSWDVAIIYIKNVQCTVWVGTFSVHNVTRPLFACEGRGLAQHGAAFISKFFQATGR